MFLVVVGEVASGVDLSAADGGCLKFGSSGALDDAIPDTMSGLAALHKGAVADGALSAKTKEPVATGIARCDGCIAYHVHDALKAGASREEVVETIGVAILIGGGLTLVYGAEAYEALNQFGAVAERWLGVLVERVRIEEGPALPNPAQPVP